MNGHRESNGNRRLGRLAGRAALASIGVAGIVWLVQEAGADEVALAFERAAPWLLLVVALEGARIAAEAAATRSVLGSEAARVPGKDTAGIHLVHYAVCMAMPAGRAAGEAVKAGMLAPHVGFPRALAVATACQALNLVTNGLLSIPCALASWAATGATSPLTLLLVAHTVVLCTLGCLVQSAARGNRLAAWLGRFPKVASSLRAFRDAARERPLMPLPALAIMTGGRLLQVAQLGILAAAVGVGAGLGEAFLGQGLLLVSSAIGDLVPGQLGVTEGAFRLSAGAFGATGAAVVSVAVLARIPQLVWIVIGALVPLLVPSLGRAGKSEAEMPRGTVRAPATAR